MSFKQKGAPYEKDNMNMAVYRKDLGDGSAAKSNHTGIILQTGLSPGEEQAAIAHEKVHQYQQRKGDLDYDKENFYWKGKTYPRENLNEHNEKLPWEVEAYKESNKLLKGEQTNKQMADKFTLRNGSGNGASFKNLTTKGLMGASLDTNPIKSKKLVSSITQGGNKFDRDNFESNNETRTKQFNETKEGRAMADQVAKYSLYGKKPQKGLTNKNLGKYMTTNADGQTEYYKPGKYKEVAESYHKAKLAFAKPLDTKLVKDKGFTSTITNTSNSARFSKGDKKILKIK